MVGSGRAEAMAAGRRAESDRHRQRVLAAIKAAGAEGEAVTVSGVARRAAGSTGPSSTDTVTCSTRFTPSPPSHRASVPRER